MYIRGNVLLLTLLCAVFLSGYDAAVDKPFEANAMQASLFEVQALLKHYVPSVSSLTKVFESPLNKQAYDLEVGWEGDTSTRQDNPPMSHSLAPRVFVYSVLCHALVRHRVCHGMQAPIEARCAHNL